MSEFQLGFEKIAPTTWVYLSSLLMLALYFKFSRTWSVRNLDLILLILLAPGLVLVQRGQDLRREGQSVGAWTFLKLGALVMPPALLLAVAGAFAFG